MSSMNASIPFDSRAYLGNPTLAPAIAFAGVYSLFLIIFAAHLLRRVSRIHVRGLAFCVIRVGAFALRAIIINSDGSSEGLLTADLIMMSTGFVAILDMMYQSLTQWLEYYVAPVHNNELVEKTVRFKRLMHIVFIAAAVLSIMGAVAQSSATTPDDLSTAQTKIRIGAAIFLGATVIMFAVSILVSFSVAGARAMGGHRASLSALPGWVIALVSAISLLRLTYAEVMAGKTPVELTWYCLSIAPEILVLIVFAWPGVADLYRKPEQELSQGWELEKVGGEADPRVVQPLEMPKSIVPRPRLRPLGG
ncbi:hypothetical protein BDK51DRAFT_26139 [Blyttiomyces helicus]|uniref:DUF7702 domain-containing protein n=1 Tax=Blyttiomyces helicus TaxID=388810 RepID=A0A4P9WN14_9FUNG|nr:hypothetical protein BDK51DRAFT_26139 [Blyttiomyces helicus]|eukprot:RKO92600.1 hypothetical protein BDK51DRAFT_26139 [Blyttiomyces helicus]